MALQDVDGPFTMPVPMAATMTLRDYFAGQALVSMVTELHMPPSLTYPYWAQTIAVNAYELADAMLAVRSK